MKKTLFLAATLLLFANAFAQNPVQPLSADNPWNSRPDVIIKGDELKNFPGGQLIEMLLGRLPGFDQVNPGQTAITIVVDGFIWPNIDALNINNIEEIAYYRGGLNTKFGTQNVSPAGVLYITSKTAKFNQPLTASVNTLFGSNSLKNGSDKDQSIFQSYHVALGQGLEKFSWRAAAVFNENTRNLNQFDFTHQFQLNGDVRFSPLKWLDLGANVNYAPLKGHSEFKWNPVYPSGSMSGNSQDNWNGAFYVKVRPIKGLVNETRILKSNVVSENENFTSYAANYEGSIPMSRKLFNNQRYENFAILNDLSYSFNIKDDRIKFKAATIFQYNDQQSKLGVRQGTFYGNEGDLSSSTAESLSESGIEMKSKGYTFTGDLSVNFYDVLSLQGGLRRDHYKGDQGQASYAPYYYADLSLKNLLLKDLAEVNEVLLFGSYGQYRSSINLVSPEFPELGLAPRIPFYNDAIDREHDKMRMQSYGVKMRFFDRISLSADWYKNDNYLYFINSYYSALLSSLLTIDNTGWRIWSTAEILKNQKFKWNAGLNVFKNQVKTEASPGTVNIIGTEALRNKTDTQAGMQQDLFYANFSLRTNTAAYFNHLVFLSNLPNSVVQTLEKASFINLNYLSLGYNFNEKIGGARFKNLNVAFVARNLTQKKKNLNDYTLSKSMGISINTSF